MEKLNGFTGVTVITLEESLLMDCPQQLTVVPLVITTLSASTYLPYEILSRKALTLFLVYLQMMNLQVSSCNMYS